MAILTRYELPDSETKPELIKWVRGSASRLKDEHDLDPLLRQVDDARYVLLGEASHGTADCYA